MGSRFDCRTTGSIGAALEAAVVPGVCSSAWSRSIVESEPFVRSCESIDAEFDRAEAAEAAAAEPTGAGFVRRIVK